jgi:hypothetical protein
VPPSSYLSARTNSAMREKITRAFVKADRLLYPHGALPIEACIESFHEHDLATNNRPDASPSETNRAVS